MLSVQEIRKLENKWKKYKIKSYSRYFLFLFLFFVCIIVLLLLFFKGTKNSVMAENNISDKVSSVDKKLPVHKQNKPIKSNIVIVSKKIKIAKKVSKKIENNNTKKTANISKNNTGKVLVLNTDFLKNVYNKQHKNIQIKKKDTVYNVKKIDKKNISSANTSVKEVNDTINKKPNIVISSKKIDEIKYLKDKFAVTSSFLYAKLLSEEYYHRRNYKKSLKWAIIANNINSNSEDSWILFAKSKVKLGKINDAIEALKIYLKVNNSDKIRVLLKNIKNGVFK